MESLFEIKARQRVFNQGNLVLKWDARIQEKGKHGKFDNIWLGPFKIHEVKGKNMFFL